MSRILFIADPHGADAVFEKSLQAIREYDISVFIMAGDLSAKDIRPIIKDDNGDYIVFLANQQLSLRESDLKEIERALSATGHYYFHCTRNEYDEVKSNENRINKLIDEKSLEKIDQWAKRIISSVSMKKTRVLITPGNDDIPSIDDILKNYEKEGIYSCVNRPISLGANEVISLDYSNSTPWHTSREVDECVLKRKIEELVGQLRCPHKAIFNFHCPPLRTRLDLAPELNGNLKPLLSIGAIANAHVGSSAVRETIEQYQPLLGLHGHIHDASGEDKIGRTICLNPGSEYENGIMHAYIIEIDIDGNLVKYHRIER